MQTLNQLPLLLDQGIQIVAIESPVTERLAVLQQVQAWATARSLPLFFWNPGYSVLQSVACDRLIGTDYHPETNILQFLLDQPISGIFILEGVIAPEPEQSDPQSIYQLINAYYDLSRLEYPQYWILLDQQVQLSTRLQSLIPVLSNPLPSGSAILHYLQSLQASYPTLLSDPQQIDLTKACLGLPFGEIQSLLQRFLPIAESIEALIVKVIDYKISKLSGRGLEFIAEPDVSVGGLDLLDQLLDRAAALLSPEATHYGLKFPKGLILWGPPGTGKSLSAKHAARKMGVPLIAADWGGLISNVPGESEANLRYLLQLVEVSSPCVLYWDDFDKAFAGWNSESGVQRRLAGKLLTWMQERTAPVFVIATVNRLEMLPAELNRRFDDIIFVDLPHAGARKEIFEIHLRQYVIALRDRPDASLFTDEQWHRLLREYNLCTAAEISTAIRKAAAEAFYQNRPGQITFDDLMHQRQQFTPAMIREEEQLLAIRKRASYARPAASPDTSKWRVPPSEFFEFLTDN